MGNSFLFGNKKIFEPGAYSRILSGVKNPPLDLDYGKIIIIDTGSGAGYIGGPGVAGTLNTDQDAVSYVSSLDEYRTLIKGGLWWVLGEPLFRPNGVGYPGISGAYIIKAATTKAAEIEYLFGVDTSQSDSSSTIAGGKLVIQIKDEGTVGNGVKVLTNLTKGYAGLMMAGVLDTSKFILKFYVGSFKGNDGDGDPYDGILEADSIPTLLAQSDEFDNIADLKAWMGKDAAFNEYFKVKTYTKSGTGNIDHEDLVHYADYELAAGGTETYNSTYLDQVLDNIGSLPYKFVLADKYADDAMHANNVSILAHLVEEARFMKFMFIGGGNNNAKFTQALGSIPISQFYDSARVSVVHSGIGVPSTLSGTGFKLYDSIYNAAAILGRTCGLAPQVPSTFKAINIGKLIHKLNDNERAKAINAGVLHLKWDDDVKKFCVNEDINSLQDNKNIVNPDGNSHLISLMRIESQLNQEIEVNARIELLSQEAGVNRNTLTTTDVEVWIKNYLTRRTATEQKDNLILSFQEVVVTTVGTAYDVKYKFEPNYEINVLLFTGFILDNSSK